MVNSPTDFKLLRRQMVERQLLNRGIDDGAVLRAMGTVPREQFVPADLRIDAYRDGPLPIGHGQTISQPYIVALMTQLANVSADSRVLDIGTGSGYQAAVLAEIVDRVFSIEIVASLIAGAKTLLEQLGYQNVEFRHGDAHRGWPEEAPFDAIIAAAAPKTVPPALIEQLAPGGRLVIPVGCASQYLQVLTKHIDGSVKQQTVTAVAFVPMTGHDAN